MDPLQRRASFLEALVEGYKAKNAELKQQLAARTEPLQSTQLLMEERAFNRALQAQVDALSKEVQELRAHRGPAQRAPDPAALAPMRRHYQQRIESAAKAALAASKSRGTDDELIAELVALRARVEEIDGPALRVHHYNDNARQENKVIGAQDSVESIRQAVLDRRLELARFKALLSQGGD